MVWACLYFCFTNLKPELYNSIKEDFPALVADFEYWCENLLVAVEQLEPVDNKFSLAELKELEFNIDTETVATIREFSRISYGRNSTVH